jgi:hypothetical protein
MHPMGCLLLPAVVCLDMPRNDGTRDQDSNAASYQTRRVLKKSLTQWGWWALGFAAGLLGFLLYLRFSPS